MKIDVELNFVDDRIYLNWWDSMHGRDIVCEIRDGEIHRHVHDPAENEELEAQGGDHDPFETKEVDPEEWAHSIQRRVENQQTNDD